ncbi:hypothetical protein L6Q79_13175 [bacterium]|nr:hypothetical protein [bacterium]NUN46656.1 hypothetical protein [bacterium]
MEKIEKIKQAKIREIIKVVLQDILLELHFNVSYLDEKLTFKLSIGDDGEIVAFNIEEKWLFLNDIKYDSFLVSYVTDRDADLFRLLQDNILNIKFGLEKTLDTNSCVIYYVKINTDRNEFLFFNNGDEGAYSFNSNIKDILNNDIYGYEWSDKPQW